MTPRAILRDAVVADPAGVLLALDFDGTLAPIVDDPTAAFVHPASLEALDRLGPRLGAVAIVTGRPVAQVLELGGFRGRTGLARLVVCGQYGAERWDATSDEIHVPDRPEHLAAVVAALPGLLADLGAPDARLEDKGLAVAVHTRGLEPGLIDSLRAPLSALAREHRLVIEPGRQVLELRAVAVDKGVALRGLVDDLRPRVVVFGGDDLGDLPAFDTVDALRGELAGFTVCSASDEQQALVPRADVVLDGPDDVAAWLTDLADALT